MQADAARLPAHPTALNLGSGKDFRDAFLNLDVDDTWCPDAVCDLSGVGDLSEGLVLDTARFGTVTLRPGCLDTIIANDVLEHVPDLMAMMTTCLDLLAIGGVFHISVPYDLSFGAWQDPTHVRAFNERSWLYYTDWFWYMGWSESRFALDALDFVPSPLGNDLRARDVPRDEIVRTPRAVDSMTVKLRKIALTPEDRKTWAFWRERKALAQERKKQEEARKRQEDERKTSAGERERMTAALARVQAVAASAAPASSGAPRAFAGPLAAQRDRYGVWIVTPAGYAHQHAYDEVALGLAEAFAELGGSAPVVRDQRDLAGRTPIVLGPQLLPPAAAATLPDDSILFNLEQADRQSPWMNEAYLSLLRRHAVVDYSGRNCAALAAFGVDHARLLPIGYAAGLTRIRRAPIQDVDVLFYGSLNPRRRRVLEALERGGARVQHLFGVYGAERDAAIGRAKIVLNMHFYETAIFESVRVSLLLANRVCVVSEGDRADPDIAFVRDGVAIAAYDDLVARCTALIADADARDAIGQAGFEAIRTRRQADLLKALFDA